MSVCMCMCVKWFAFLSPFCSIWNILIEYFKVNVREEVNELWIITPIDPLFGYGQSEDVELSHLNGWQIHNEALNLNKFCTCKFFSSKTHAIFTVIPLKSFDEFKNQIPWIEKVFENFDGFQLQYKQIEWSWEIIKFFFLFFNQHRTSWCTQSNDH